MLSFDEARTQLLAQVKRVGSERVPLSQAAGRVTEGSLHASMPLPAYDFSAMDGYAVALEDFKGEGPWTLPVIGTSSAGHAAPIFQQQSTCRIFTGAPLPNGANGVVMQEQVTRNDATALFAQRPDLGANIRRAGEDMAQGALAIAAGTRLHPGHLALAAMLGQAELCVAKKPIVTVLCTGDELRAPGSRLEGAQIFESNSAAVGALAKQAGAIVHFAPLVSDEPTATVSAVLQALRNSNLLVTIGGVSVGDHDFVRPALERAGVNLDFWKVAIKPGKPLVVGHSAHAHVLGLPGNPASALVTFALFGMPLLRAMQVDAHPTCEPQEAHLTHSTSHSPNRLEFARATAFLDQGKLQVTLHKNQSSGAATSLAECNCLALLPAEISDFAKGACVEILRFADF